MDGGKYIQGNEELTSWFIRKTIRYRKILRSKILAKLNALSKKRATIFRKILPHDGNDSSSDIDEGSDWSYILKGGAVEVPLMRKPPAHGMGIIFSGLSARNSFTARVAPGQTDDP